MTEKDAWDALERAFRLDLPVRSEVTVADLARMSELLRNLLDGSAGDSEVKENNLACF